MHTRECYTYPSLSFVLYPRSPTLLIRAWYTSIPPTKTHAKRKEITPICDSSHLHQHSKGTHNGQDSTHRSADSASCTSDWNNRGWRGSGDWAALCSWYGGWLRCIGEATGSSNSGTNWGAGYFDWSWIFGSWDHSRCALDDLDSDIVRRGGVGSVGCGLLF